MVNFICFTDGKCSSYKHLATWGMKSGVLRSKSSTILQTVCAGAMYVLFPHKCAKVIIFRRFFVAAMIKRHQFVISEPDEVYHRSRAAIQRLLALVATSKFVLTHIMTSALHHD